MDNSKIKEIEKNGFCVIKKFLPKKTVLELLKKVNFHYNRNKHRNYIGIPSRDNKDKILYNLQNKDHKFIKILTNKKILKIAKYFLNDETYKFLPSKKPNFIINYFNARSSGNKLDLHIDSWIPYLGKKTHMMQFVFLLEKSTEDNGCTIVVKKSHRSGQFSNNKSKKIISITGEPGDLIIWDSRLWHGTKENKSNVSRWAIVTTISSWWVKQAMDMPKSLPKKILKKCSNLEKQLLGFCSIPPVDETERINTKCGYEILEKNFYKKKNKYKNIFKY
jgi:ectoine hydroxylase-related dioxygenase (phytanoyl-CoA dioxygenase family)